MHTQPQKWPFKTHPDHSPRALTYGRIHAVDREFVYILPGPCGSLRPPRGVPQESIGEPGGCLEGPGGLPGVPGGSQVVPKGPHDAPWGTIWLHSLKTFIFLRFFVNGWSQKPRFSLGFLMVHLNNCPHFPANNAKIVVLYSLFGGPGVLKRIYWIYQIYRKCATASSTDPGFSTPGGRMTVVYTNSLKLSGPEKPWGNVPGLGPSFHPPKLARLLPKGTQGARF